MDKRKQRKFMSHLSETELKAYLENLYQVELLTLYEIAQKTQSCDVTIRRYFKKYNIPIRTRGPRKGQYLREEAFNWKGGKYTKDGYVFVRHNETYIQEHRLVMEQHLGRKLRSHEVVHHKDRNRSNNSIENLELCSDRTEHMLHYTKIDHPKTKLGKRLKQLFLSGLTWDEIADRFPG